MNEYKESRRQSEGGFCNQFEAYVARQITNRIVCHFFSVVNRRRRDIQKDDIPKDVYNELATAQKVKSFHTFVIFVAMDPNKDYLALLGSKMCALLKGTDIRCVNEEDCKLMAEVGIDCPYKFGNGGTGKGSGSGSGSGNGANKGKSTGKKDESSAPQPWIYGVSSVFVIAIVVIVLAIFVLRRRRTKRKVTLYTVFPSMGVLDTQRK